MRTLKDPIFWAGVGIIMLAVGAVMQDKVMVLVGGIVAAMFTAAWWADGLF